MIEHEFKLSEIDEMLPWEKKIYLDILIQKLKDRAEANSRGPSNESF